jgi:hypothetical protein
MAQKVLKTEKQIRKHFSNTFKGKELDEVVLKVMSDEPLFPEKVRRAKERIARIDVEKLRPLAQNKK